MHLYNREGGYKMQPHGQVIVTTTTFYKDPDSKDKVRFGLACELVELAKNDGHIVVIVDGSPGAKVRKELKKRGAHVALQLEEGMGSARRQVWNEAKNFVSADTAAIIWTEEKPDIVFSIANMVACMREQDARIVIPSRSRESWETYPVFQRESEQVANLVYNNLFSSPDEPFDPMFGPVCFRPDELPLFVGFNPAEWGVPDTYVQFYAPILLFLRRLRVASVRVDFNYPLEQRVEEKTDRAMEIIEKRLMQLKQLVTSFFIMHKRSGFDHQNRTL